MARDLFCEDCEEEIEEGQRRIRCVHCNLLVCGFCWHHFHRCEPGHSRAECWSIHLEMAPVDALIEWADEVKLASVGGH